MKWFKGTILEQMMCLFHNLLSLITTRHVPVLIVCAAAATDTFAGAVVAMVIRVVRTFWESLGIGWVRFRAVAGPGKAI